MLHDESRLRALMPAGLDDDSRAYRELLQDLSVHLRACYRHRLSDDQSVVEDLVQVTRTAADVRRAGYHRTQPLTTLVFAIARYRLVSHHRRGRVRE